MRRTILLIAAVLPSALGCGGGGGSDPGGPANEAVRTQLELAAPATLGHRGTGPTRPLGRFPENSLPAFLAAVAAGADGVELDVVLTADRRLLVMHDDTLDRTTTCRGCVNAHTLSAAQSCLLRDGGGRATEAHPPALADVYAALPRRVLVNVELKVFGSGCADRATGAVALARAAVAEVQRLRAESRTIFSSFDRIALAALKDADPTLYAALVTSAPQPGLIEDALGLGLEAVHPFFTGVDAAFVSAAHAAGLQVNVWTANGRNFLRQVLALDVDGIITDEPDVLEELKGMGRSSHVARGA